MLKIILTFIVLAAISSAHAANLSDVSNYRQYSHLLSSSGQPTNEQLKQAAEQGFRRVIYLAYTNNDSAIEHEDSTVKELGMDYVHIPIDFKKPTVDDFKTFALVMQQRDSTKTLVHCQVNFRASTFSFLYRAIYLKVPILEAKEALDSVWAPNETWFRFIRSVLENHGLTHACEGCDWGEHEFIDE